jgi:hypothetical protein
VKLEGAKKWHSMAKNAMTFSLSISVWRRVRAIREVSPLGLQNEAEASMV